MNPTKGMVWHMFGMWPTCDPFDNADYIFFLYDFDFNKI